MKTKVIIFVMLSAIVTLSFTFVATRTTNNRTTQTTQTKSEASNEPLGGFVSEERL